MTVTRLSVVTPAGEALSIVLLLPSLLSAAIWSGGPVIFFDTAAYMVQGLGYVFMPERSSVYSLFLEAAGTRDSLWIAALLQCLIVAFLMVQLARVLRPVMSVWMLALIGAALAIVTGISWYAAQIEPDCFTAAAVIGLYLLLFQGLGFWRNLLVALATALAIAVHASHVGVAAGLLVTAALTQLPFIRRRLGASFLAPNLIPAVMSFTLAIVVIFICNYALAGQIFFSRAGAVFLASRMMEDGLIKPVLDDTCPQSRYVLCSYKDRLPARADDWLWDASPFARLGGFKGLEAESSSLVVQSIRREPLANLGAAVHDTLAQLVQFQTGDGIVKQKWVPVPKYGITIPLKAERGEAGLRNSEAAFLPLNVIHVPIGFLSLAALFWLLWDARRNGDLRRGTIIGFVLLALAGNAFICGVFSGPHGRYQSRIMWLATFTVVLAARPGAFSLRQRGESGT